MPEYAADDAAFIAARLKEIEEEKQKAREKPAYDINTDIGGNTPSIADDYAGL